MTEEIKAHYYSDRFVKRAKYSNRSCTCHKAHIHASVLEADLCNQLGLMEKAGEVRRYVSQFKIEITVQGNHICNHYVDFKVTFADGHAEFWEAKGYDQDVLEAQEKARGSSLSEHSLRRKARKTELQKGLQMHGKVKWFSNEKKYGFITAQDGSEVFVHFTDIKTGDYKTLKENENVTFDLTKGPRGDRAANVVRINVKTQQGDHMKKFLTLILVTLSLTSSAFAEERSKTSLLMAGEYLKTRSNQADDGFGGLARIEHPIYKELSGAVEFQYHGRTHFPSVQDPKGSFGAIYGYGPIVSLVFRPDVNETFSPYVIGGAGWFFWDFAENPFLKDNAVDVDVKDGIVTRVGIGLDYKFSSAWSLTLEYGYFNADVEKISRGPNGATWNVPCDKDNCGMDEHQGIVGLRYLFS